MDEERVTTDKTITTPPDLTKILPIELLNKIFDFLTPLEIYKLRQLSKHHHTFLSQNFVFERILKRIKFPIEFIKQLKKPLVKTFEYFYKNVEYLNMPLIYVCLEASSTDHHSQSIEMTRSSEDFTFWSSTGSPTPAGTQYLTFNLYGQDCLIKRILIKPFLAQFQRGLPCYAPLRVTFQIGTDKNHLYYTSPIFEMTNTPTIQIFELDAMVRGGFVKINLIGYHQSQPGDGLYYHAIEMVDIQGIWGSLMGNADIRQALKMDGKVDEDEEWFDDLRLRRGIIDEILREIGELGLQDAAMIFIPNHVRIGKKDCSKESLERLIVRIGLDRFEEAQSWLDCVEMKRSMFAYFKRGNNARARFVFSCIPSDYRDQELLDEIFKVHEDATNSLYSIWKFLCEESFPLSESETIMLLKMSVERNDLEILHTLLQKELVTPTLALGMAFENVPGLKPLALHVYHAGRVIDKIIELYMFMNRFRDAAHAILTTYPLAEILPFLRDLRVKFSRVILARLLVNLIILMEYDGMLEEDNHDFYGQVGVLLEVRDSVRRSELFSQLGEIADSVE